MAKKNTNFRLGLNRQDLIEAAKMFGKAEKSAKKANTKRLEQFVASNLLGKGTKIPEFSEKQKRDIRDSTKSFGLKEGLHMVSSRIRRATGSHNENNFLRLTVGKALEAYTDEEVTNEDISAIIGKIAGGSKDDIISGVERHEAYYQNIILDYLDEKEEREQKPA